MTFSLLNFSFLPHQPQSFIEASGRQLIFCSLPACIKNSNKKKGSPMSKLRQAQGVVNLVAHFLTIFQLRHPASIYGHFHLVDLQQGWGRLTTLLFLLSHFFLANELRYKDLGAEVLKGRKPKSGKWQMLMVLSP